jgi:predicted component of type VI protein secretion system
MYLAAVFYEATKALTPTVRELCLGSNERSPPTLTPVALQALTDLGRLTYRRFLELFRHMVGLHGLVISPLQGLFLHRTTQHRKTRTNILALSGIRTHDPRNQPAKTHASDRTAAVTMNVVLKVIHYIKDDHKGNTSSYFK